MRSKSTASRRLPMLVAMLVAMFVALGVMPLGAPGAAAAGAWAAAPATATAISAVDLRVEDATTPLGVDDVKPSLSWRLTAQASNVHQSAYRVLVATDPDLLTPAQADAWDSGRVQSSNPIGIQYDGEPLEPSTRYYWTVQVWDDGGTASAWSASSWWETALLDDGWAGAEFIAPDTADALMWQDLTLEGDFTIDSGAASFLFRVEDSSNFYMWQINAATEPGKVMLRPHVRVNGGFSNLGDVDLAPVLTPANLGEQHHIEITVNGNSFVTRIDGVQVDSRTDTALNVAGTIGFRTSSTAGQAERARYDNLKVSALGGATLFQDDFSVSPDPRFPQTPLTDGQLAPTDELTIMSREPEAPLMRSDFQLSGQVASARAYVYGLGLYELHLNGEKVGDLQLTPTAGQYQTHLYYDTYDVTEEVRNGENAIGLWLGDGYNKDYNGYAFRFLGDKRGIVLVKVTYTDGSTETVTSGDSWTWSDGPVVANDMYDGETYDARLEEDGWDSPGFDDTGWDPVRTLDAPAGALVANPAPPRRVVETLQPIAVTQPQPGVFVFDLGQNIAGWARLHVSGPAGAKVTIATAEELGDNGLLNTRTNRDAAATDSYVLRGGGVETWEPRFTYHGFRYVQVTGYPGTPTVSDVDGRVVHADVESTGDFSSSDELLNTIWRNNRWAILNNSMSTPTDTPVRDERTPPAMDVQAYRDAAVREFDMAGFYAKYLGDLPPGTALPNDDSKAQYPDMAGGQVSLAWSLYQEYGDIEPLRENYGLMKAFVDRNVTDKPSLIWPADEGFGDWCPPVHGAQANGGMGGPNAGDCFSEVSLVNTALWYQQARDVARAATALGHPDDAAHFDGVAEDIKDAFNDHFLNDRGDTYGDGRMTTSVLPLALGLVRDEDVTEVGNQFVRTILRANDGHLDTGIFGTRYLVDALAAIGRMDVAMTVLGKTTYPSFGFQIAHGATTPWEEWTYDAGMITHDHAMFAGVNSSLYTRLGGITPDEPGYATMTISPEVPASLDHARVEQDTVRGKVTSSWQQSAGEFQLTVTVPVNTDARVEVPTFGRDAAAVVTTGPATPAGQQDGRAIFTVGSGTYRFVIAKKAPVLAGHVTVMGRAAVGSTLYGLPGSWSPDEVQLSYAWTRAGSTQVLGTGPSYLVQPADAGANLVLRVTGSAPERAAVVASSSQVLVEKVQARLATKVLRGPGKRPAVLRVNVSAPYGVAARGRVRVYARGHRIASAVLVRGRARLSLRLPAQGTTIVRVVYAGSASVSGVSRQVVLRS